MGMLLYLLLSAGFFILIMRFGCGAHVMGHGQHSAEVADSRHNQNELDRSTDVSKNAAIEFQDHNHG